MNEIEKMYMRCKIEKQQTCSHSDTCDDGSLDECEGCNAYQYPPFTAEKQIELIKWLSDTDYYILHIYKTIDTKEYFIDNYYYDMQTDKLEETLAGLVNKFWQDLTKEERKQIKEILE